MARNKDERTIKKVAILGAGASADAGAPVLNDFFPKVQELINSKKFLPDEIKTFEDVLAKRERLLPNSNIEEFLSFVDFQINFDVLIPVPEFVRKLQRKSFHNNIPNSVPICPDLQQSGYGKEDFEKLKKNIELLICKTLDETLKDTKPKIIQVYQKLIDRFDVIISFNWDVLCEQAYQSEWGSNILDFKQLGFDERVIVKPALLKLHGSFIVRE